MRKLVYPLAVVLLALLWQTATVNINYSGNWTALFCTGDLRPTPPALASENIYTFTGSNGFDGQYYHYIAHDPWPGGKMSSYVDAAGIRYCRILLPAAAYLLALGRQQFIDFAYIAAGLAFLFLGVWWFRVFSERSGRPPEWALVFPLLPASMIFFDRLTVDHGSRAGAAGPGYRVGAGSRLLPLLSEPAAVEARGVVRHGRAALAGMVLVRVVSRGPSSL